VVWRGFPWARCSGHRIFDSPCCFISAKCGFSISARFWSLGAHAVCFCALVAILDLIAGFILKEDISTHKQKWSVRKFRRC
jgi:hypothetical protein